MSKPLTEGRMKGGNGAVKEQADNKLTPIKPPPSPESRALPMDEFEQLDLTAAQEDYAVFLPALSGFYATYVGKQQAGEYVPYTRVPFANGMESINWLNKDKAMFPYKWALYSAGHANLDITKEVPKEDMIRKRDRANTFVLGDSGGFQVAKGKWPGDWRANSGCPAAAKKRKEVLTWLDEYMDYGMVLDIPTWVVRDKVAQEACKITTYQGAVDATRFNNDYFMANRKGYKNGGCKLLNVLQGSSHEEADDWYEQVKEYCDPTVYPDTHFNGWSMGGQNMCDVHLILSRIVDLHFDGLLQEGIHDWMHFLGTSRLEYALILTDIQRAVRKNYNPNFTISFDCASPFLATANGRIYTHCSMEDREKWSYSMAFSLDNKKYSQDTRKLRDAMLQDKWFERFDYSPVLDSVLAKDVCIYGPGDLNKIGKEGATSWDSFSYTVQMTHNVWKHIETVQEANRRYDAGLSPKMLVQEAFDRVYCREVIEMIFSCDNREDAQAIINHYTKFWMQIVGSRGFAGKKAENPSTQFNKLFTIVHPAAEDAAEIEQDDEEALDTLEHTLDE